MDANILLIDIILVILPIVYVLAYSLNKDESIVTNMDNNIPLIRFFQGFLVFNSVLFSFQTIYEVFIMESMLFYIPFLFLITSILLFLKFTFEQIENRFYFISIVLLLIFLILIITQPLYVTKINIEQNIIEIAPTIFILIIVATLTPILVLFLFNRYYKKRVFAEVSEEDVKILIVYFLILIVFFSTLSLIAFFVSVEASLIFRGQDFANVGDVLNIIMITVISDPLFVFTAVFTMFGAIVTVLGYTSARIFGNMVMTFMPMIMFLQYFFGNIPTLISTLFEGWEWLGRIFYILLTLMLITMVLSAWKLFSSITVSGFRVD